jgi:peptidoglycan/LPS O-acetylase OafA/YrhL
MRIEAPKDEIVSLTSLRGIAALFVVFHHYSPILRPAVDIHGMTKFFQFGGVWVSFFFLLSGYILAEVYYERMRAGRTDTRRFLLARLIRIYPLHLFMLLVMLAVEFAKFGMEIGFDVDVGAFSDKNSLPAFIANLFLVQTWGLGLDLTWNSPAWSISVEWACYLLFPLVLGARILDRTWGAALVAIVGASYWVLQVPILQALRESGIDPNRFDALLGGFALFLLGMALHRLSHARKLPNAAVLSVVQVATFALTIYFLHVGTANWHLLPLFVLLIVTTREDRGALCAFLKLGPVYRLGVISYSVYLTHLLFAMVFSPDVGKILPFMNALRAEPLGAWASFGAALTATIVFSIFTYEFIERRVRIALTARLLGPKPARSSRASVSA